MAIGKRIKFFRNRKGMTQKQLGEITKEEYDEWRYKYPELDTHQIWAKVPPQELFDFINDAAKEAESTDKKETKRKKKK